jgi:hypothetical protein
MRIVMVQMNRLEPLLTSFPLRKMIISQRKTPQILSINPKSLSLKRTLMIRIPQKAGGMA